jgi:hypothetical protein
VEAVKLRLVQLPCRRKPTRGVVRNRARHRRRELCDGSPGPSTPLHRLVRGRANETVDLGGLQELNELRDDDEPLWRKSRVTY